MSQQGPIIVVSTAERPSFASALDEAKLFPVIDTAWADASRAVAQLQPAAVFVAMSANIEPGFAALAKQIAARQPYLPLIAVDPRTSLPENAIPFSQTDGNFDRLIARLRACLRTRTLHSTVLRRLDDDPAVRATLVDATETARDATVLLIGRGAAYPALSVSLGERMGVVGALSIEAAAKHLNTRDIDGIVLGEGFSARVVDAFLTVLAEDARFRNLPVVVTSDALAPAYDLPNLEIISGEPAHIAANAWPLIRQHAFEAHLSRTLRSIDAGGLLDPRTGLLTSAAFNRDFATAVYQTLSRGGGLSVARFAFDPAEARAPARRRADHQPPDAANGFRRGPGRRLRDRGVRRDRSAHRPHDRAAAFQRDAAHQPWQTRQAVRAGGHARDHAAVGYGEIAAGAALRRSPPRRVLNRS